MFKYVDITLQAGKKVVWWIRATKMWDNPEKTKKNIFYANKVCKLSKAELNTPNEISFVN